MSVPLSELVPPAPSTASECVPPWNQRGDGQHSLADEGAGRANSDDWKEILALCTLWPFAKSVCQILFAVPLKCFRDPYSMKYQTKNTNANFTLSHIGEYCSSGDVASNEAKG